MDNYLKRNHRKQTRKDLFRIDHDRVKGIRSGRFVSFVPSFTIYSTLFSSCCVMRMCMCR